MRKGFLVVVSAVVFLTLLPVPSFSQVAEEDAELAGPPGQQKPKVPAKPTPRWPDGQPMMGAAPGEKGTWGSCCGRLANDKTPFQPWAKAVFADRGEPSPTAPFSPFEQSSELRKVGRVAKGVTGTRVRYWADPQIFTKGAAFQLDDLLNRARQTAFLVPGLSISVVDQRGEEPETHLFRFDGGISEFVEHLAVDGPVTDVWRLTGDGRFTETVPVLSDHGAMIPTDVERHCHVDIALRWGIGYDTVVRSFVNIIATPKGGTHQAGFEQGLLRFLRQQVEQNARRLKVGNDKLEKDDVLAGLTVVLTVRLPEPQFEGQTKEVLGTPAVRSIVASVVQNSTMGNPEVEQCIAGAVRRWEFPKPQGGGIVIVSYPFVLKAAGTE